MTYITTTQKKKRAIKEKKKAGAGSGGALANLNTPEPARNEDCRVCQYLQKQGSHQNYLLFENHMGEGTFQCPSFMKLKSKERSQLIQKIKLCPYCLDHKVTTDKQHERECKDKKPQYSESWKCASPGCGRHSWICQTHADNANKVLSILHW